MPLKHLLSQTSWEFQNEEGRHQGFKGIESDFCAAEDKAGIERKRRRRRGRQEKRGVSTRLENSGDMRAWRCPVLFLGTVLWFPKGSVPSLRFSPRGWDQAASQGHRRPHDLDVTRSAPSFPQPQILGQGWAQDPSGPMGFGSRFLKKDL